MAGVIRIKKLRLGRNPRIRIALPRPALSLRKSYPFVLMIIMVVSIILLPGILKVLIPLFCTGLFVIWGYGRVGKGDGEGAMLLLASPILLSAFQNVYLALGSKNMAPGYMEILLSLHMLIMFGVVGIGIIRKRKRLKCAVASFLFFGMIVQSAISLFAYHAPIKSFLSSFRNIIACFLVYVFTVFIGERVGFDRFLHFVLGIATVVAVFGLFEWAKGLSVWQGLGISRLWDLKGIPTAEGIPPNWYSSEHIGGHAIRRMVATFADPVNLGSFLFASFLAAWYMQRERTSCLMLLCCVLTVSKAALLGILIYAVVYVWFNRNLRFLIPVSAMASLVAGAAFLSYIRSHSTGSAIWHIMNFTRSFAIMLQNPLGLGIGRIGVMAGLTGGTTGTAAANIIEESGLGVINAQLGILGALWYAGFFLYLMSRGLHHISDNRTKVFYYSLLFSYIANMAFNEVALSPNSCAIYFILLGMANLHCHTGDGCAIAAGEPMKGRDA